MFYTGKSASERDLNARESHQRASETETHVKVILESALSLFFACYLGLFAM